MGRRPQPRLSSPTWSESPAPAGRITLLTIRTHDPEVHPRRRRPPGEPHPPLDSVDRVPTLHPARGRRDPHRWSPTSPQAPRPAPRSNASSPSPEGNPLLAEQLVEARLDPAAPPRASPPPWPPVLSTRPRHPPPRPSRLPGRAAPHPPTPRPGLPRRPGPDLRRSRRGTDAAVNTALEANLLALRPATPSPTYRFHPRPAPPGRRGQPPHPPNASPPTTAGRSYSDRTQPPGQRPSRRDRRRPPLGSCRR